MTTTFASTELKNAGKLKTRYPTLTNETTLMSGKNYIQKSTQYKTEAIIEGFCQQADKAAILSLVGTQDSLVTEYETLTNMVIKETPEFTESDDPGWFNYRIVFGKHSA